MNVRNGVVVVGQAFGAGLVVTVLAFAGCSGGGGGGDTSATATTQDSVSTDQRESAIGLSVAATGINLVATEVSLRAAGGAAANYCRSEALAELEPHSAALEAAADPEARQRAQVALAELREVLELCSSGADAAATQKALESYRASFERLRQRIEALGGDG